jgi:hypothetical protein
MSAIPFLCQSLESSECRMVASSSCERFYDVVRLTLLNIRSESVLIANTDKTSSASWDDAK